MGYSVKEIFYTLQGEGAYTGRAAVFCRFSGCNLWSGSEQDRERAVCNFCDTDFVGTDGLNGAKFATPVDLVNVVKTTWAANPNKIGRPLVVCTGGEPLLQLDVPLVQSLKDAGFEVAVETNGTKFPPDNIDWLCVSPKSRAETILRSGDELKLVFPQIDAEPEKFEDWNFKYFFLQPMDGHELELNTRLAVEYCLANPQWRLSLQTHKIVGIP